MKDAKNKICDWIEIETQEGSVDKDALAEFILDLVLEEYSQDSAKRMIFAEGCFKGIRAVDIANTIDRISETSILIDNLDSLLCLNESDLLSILSKNGIDTNDLRKMVINRVLENISGDLSIVNLCTSENEEWIYNTFSLIFKNHKIDTINGISRKYIQNIKDLCDILGYDEIKSYRIINEYLAVQYEELFSGLAVRVNDKGEYITNSQGYLDITFNIPYGNFDGLAFPFYNDVVYDEKLLELIKEMGISDVIPKSLVADNHQKYAYYDEFLSDTNELLKDISIYCQANKEHIINGENISPKLKAIVAVGEGDGNDNKIPKEEIDKIMNKFLLILQNSGTEIEGNESDGLLDKVLNIVDASIGIIGGLVKYSYVNYNEWYNFVNNEAKFIYGFEATEYFDATLPTFNKACALMDATEKADLLGKGFVIFSLAVSGIKAISYAKDGDVEKATKEFRQGALGALAALTVGEAWSTSVIALAIEVGGTFSLASGFLVGALGLALVAVACYGLVEMAGDFFDFLGNKFEEWLDGEIGAAIYARLPVDPLILDLDGTGFKNSYKKDGAYFDLNSDGYAEKINWTNTNGILAFDLNENGIIDDGREVFGDYHLLADGSRAQNGFEALAQYDTDGNGIIDSDDEIFEKLKVWVDSNGDGVSDTKELKSLKELGIKEIKLNYIAKNQSTDTEALIGNVATYVKEDDTEGSIGEMWVASDLFDTVEKVVTGISEVVDGLPNVRSYGTINSLHNAISNDETGELKKMVEEFVELKGTSERIAKTQEILAFICGANDVEEGSRGSSFSAKKLAVIEKFIGESFVGMNGGNPNSVAAPILENVYKNLVEMYCVAMIGSGISDLLKFLMVVKDDEGRDSINTELAKVYFGLGIKFGTISIEQITDVCSYLNYYGSNIMNDLRPFDSIRSYFVENIPDYVDYIDKNVFGSIHGDKVNNSLVGSIVADVIYGEEGNDSISSGRGNDLIYGGADNDTIHGDEGDDIIYGDEGDDYLDGGSGNDILIDSEGDDTFVFGRGYGQDEIRDDGGKNSIRFAGLSPRDISVNGLNDFDVRITIKSTGETLTIKNFRKDETLADYTLIFDNVTMHCTDEKSPFRHIYGGDGDDVLKAAVPDSTMHSFGGDDTVIGSKGNDVIYSGTGKDTIEAGAGDDIVYGETGDDNIRGEAGRDVIYGGSGNDIISGGLDDDVLIGGEGNDTYIFGRGFGIDVIDDIEGDSVIRLESGISADDINVYISGSEAVIAIKNAFGDDTESAVSTDRLVIKDYVGNEDKYSIVIAGETKDLSDMIIIPDAEEAAAVEDTSLITGTDDYNYVVSGEETETILGDGHLDRILASFGDDTLFGGEGNDQLFGEEGKDFIFGNEGDEYINGGLDNDVISGGAGKDFIDGGEGDDVYIYNLGDGTDSIKDSEGLNRIVFGEGIDPNAIKCYRSNWNDLMVTFDGTADNIIIKNYCISKEARNFELVFADGTVVDATDAESPLRTIYGTNGSEYMASIYEDGITMIGQDGYDEVHGGAGNDNLHGGAGDDRVIGEAGNDTLFGETGRDYLAGGAGDDTYIYRAGDGIDTFSDSEGTNYISIEGYSIGDVKAYRTNWNNLTIVFGDGNVNSDYRADGTMQDKLVIENFFVSDNSRNYYISYNGSGMIHAAASNSPLRTIYSTNGNEYMLAMDDNGVTLIASDGYNTINGGAGSDRLFGGTGNDSILGNAGNDYIDGKTGDDTLLGGAGNDTYIFDAGYGIDRIVEDTGVNTIQFGAGIDKESITAERFENNDLKLSFGDTDDRLILTGYFAEEDRRKYDVSFADGERFGFEDEENPISLAYEDAAAIELQNQIDEFENAFEAEESAPIAEETDLQTMKLVEDMAGFGAEGEVSEGVSFTDDTATLLSDQIIITDSEI